MNFDNLLINVLISTLSILILINFVMFIWVISIFLTLRTIGHRVEDAIDSWKKKP